ncbi:MAG: class I SAM-dependent methyltransferase [Lachnospiraceae bacterium]|nr:class I SAM-dependent methyltransferase [Lachnospiraceae bacterium]
MKELLKRILMRLHFYDWIIVYKIRDKLMYRRIETACKNPPKPRNFEEAAKINFYRDDFISEKNKELVELCKKNEAGKISEWYDGFGNKKYYDEYLKHRMNLRMVCRFIEKTYSKCKILDIACGHGEMCLYLARKGYLVYGLDLNKYRVAFLKDKLEDIRCESAEDTHVADLKKVLLNMYRLIIPGRYDNYCTV